MDSVSNLILSSLSMCLRIIRKSVFGCMGLTYRTIGTNIYPVCTLIVERTESSEEIRGFSWSLEKLKAIIWCSLSVYFRLCKYYFVGNMSQHTRVISEFHLIGILTFQMLNARCLIHSLGLFPYSCSS